MEILTKLSPGRHSDGAFNLDVIYLMSDRLRGSIDRRNLSGMIHLKVELVVIRHRNVKLEP